MLGFLKENILGTPKDNPWQHLEDGEEVANERKS
jgi:hypothetical protein